MKLNLGCGNSKMAGWVNVDKFTACQPDQVVDLEALPWPWADNSVEAVNMAHVLEHLGPTTDIYLGIIKELYRVCRDGATVTITVPHPRHDHFLDDPTHVRVVTEWGLSMFSQDYNRQAIAQKLANTPLGIYLDVDFAIQSVRRDLAEPWAGRFQRKEISEMELQHAAQCYNNVIAQVCIVMRAVKKKK